MNMTRKKVDSDLTFARLEKWYESMCNDDWEHTYGIRIETLDNPGWMLTVDVKDTPLFGVAFAPLRNEKSETDWIQADVTDGVFRATGSLGRLEQILRLFVEWAEGVATRST